MQEDTIAKAEGCSELPTPKQFRATFKEIFESETTFGSAKAAREELLENVQDIINEYLDKGSRIVYLHGKLKEAGYTGSRKELSEWLVAKGLWIKREIAEKGEEKTEESENDSCKGSESGEVSVSPSGSTPEVAPNSTDNKNESSDKNAGQAASEENQKSSNHPNTSKPNFAPAPGKSQTVYSGTVNPNRSKN